MEKWVPVFWIIGICLGFFLVLMILDFLKMKRKKPDHNIN
jgi:hypothetical protein